MDLRWYETFFDGIVLDAWRQAVSPEQTRAECDFLLRELRLGPGARVLDVPCGDGRHAIRLAARGCRVTGVDVSAAQLREARARRAPHGGSVEWRQADMRDLPWHGEFDACCCMGNSFAYLDPGGTGAFLQAVGRALKPGGRFVMDTGLAAESILTHFEEHQSAQVGDILFTEENRYVVEESCIETAYTFERDGEKATRTGLQWVFTIREIGEMLREAGLDVVACYGGVDGSPFAVGNPVLVLVAARA